MGGAEGTSVHLGGWIQILYVCSVLYNTCNTSLPRPRGHDQVPSLQARVYSPQPNLRPQARRLANPPLPTSPSPPSALY